MAASAALAPSRVHDLHRLRTEIARMQRRRGDASGIQLDPLLGTLLPQGMLRSGSAYSLSPSPSLLSAFLSHPSQQGIWSAAVGMPTFGFEAAAGFGVDLSHLIFVPSPGAHEIRALSALSEVVPLIALRPAQSLSAADISRLHARLRDRHCTLLVLGTWPQSEAIIRIEQSTWRGLENGSGLLRERDTTISSTTRQGEKRQIRLRLPGPSGRAEAPEKQILRPLPRLVPEISETSIPQSSPERWADAG